MKVIQKKITQIHKRETASQPQSKKQKVTPNSNFIQKPLVKSSKKPIASQTQLKNTKGVLVSYLDQQTPQGYVYASNVYAQPQALFKGEPDDVIYQEGSIVYFQSEIKPENSYQVVKTPKGQIGYFTEELVVVSKKRFIEDTKKELDMRNLTYSIHGRSFIIKISNLEDSLNLQEELRTVSSIKFVDVHIQTSVVVPK